MKKIYMTMAALLCGVAAMAQTQAFGSLSCEDVELVAGSEDAAYLEVMLTTENLNEISGIQFYFSLPDGINIAQVYDEDEEAYLDDVSFPIAKKAHQVGLKATQEGYMVFLGGDASLTFKAVTNPVVKIGIVASANAMEDNQIVFNKAAMSDKGQGANKKSYAVEDFVANVHVIGGTGINGVNAIDSNAPIYNVAGQRVSKAQKGVFIQNGKKVAVK